MGLFQGCHKIRSPKLKDNSRMFQLYFRHFQGCQNVKDMPRSSANLISRMSFKIQGLFKGIPEFKIKFKDLLRISRIGIKLKDFKDFFKDVATLRLL